MPEQKPDQQRVDVLPARFGEQQGPARPQYAVELANRRVMVGEVMKGLMAEDHFDRAVVQGNTNTIAHSQHHVAAAPFGLGGSKSNVSPIDVQPYQCLGPKDDVEQSERSPTTAPDVDDDG